MSMHLAQPLTLPCGAIIPNRLAKAAMTEGLATAQGVPTPALDRLYGLWSDGGYLCGCFFCFFLECFELRDVCIGRSTGFYFDLYCARLPCRAVRF